MARYSFRSDSINRILVTDGGAGTDLKKNGLSGYHITEGIDAS